MVSARSPLLLIIATAAYALTPYAPPWASAIVGIPVIIGYCIVLPGILINHLARLTGRDPLEAAALACTSGLAFLLLCAFAWALTGVSVDAFRLALPAVIIALAVISPRRDATRIDPLRTRLRIRDRRLLVVLALLIVQPVVGVLLAGPSMRITEDTIDHAGYVAEIARTGNPFPTTAIYANPGPDGQDIRKALLHAIYGFTARHAGVSPIAALTAYGGFLLLVMILVVYTTTRSMLRGHRLAAAIAVVLFLIGTDWSVTNPLIRAAFYPNRFGAAFLLLFIASALEYLHRGPTRALGWCALYAFAATAVHIQYAVFVAVAAGIIMLWKACSPCETLEEHLGRSARIAVAGALGAGPFAIYRFLTAYQTNPLHKQVQSAVFVTGKWFMADPARVWQTIGPLGVAAIVCIVPLWRRRRDVPGVGYAIAAMITYLVIEFVPFVLTPVYGVLKYLTFRLDAVVPYYLLPAYLLAARPRAPRAMAVTIAAIALVGLPLFGHTAFSQRVLEKERNESPERWARGLYQLATAFPAGSVIASDPVTSYMMSAFTPYYVVCTLDQHAPPNDQHFEQRMITARDIVSPYTTAREKESLMRQNHVAYVVINSALPRGLLLNYWTMDPSSARKADAIFRSLHYEFDPVSFDDGLTAFRWRYDERLSTLPRPAPRPVVDAIPPDANAIGVRSGEAILVGARLRAGGDIPAGGQVSADLFWSRLPKTPPGTYVVAVRFDREHLDLPFGGRPFPKITRKIVEKIKRERFRFRQDHMVRGGLFPPDAWSEGEIVEDNARIAVPTDIAPGRYRVQAKMLRVSNQENHWLHDYFFDDDNYTGVEIGEVTIQK